MVVTIHIENKKLRDFIEASDINMWVIFEFSYEFPKIMINRVFQPKVKISLD